MTDETDENTPRQMIDTDAVLKLVPICLRTVRRMEKRGTFPAGRVVAGRKLWFADEIARWQSNLGTEVARRGNHWKPGQSGRPRSDAA